MKAMQDNSRRTLYICLNDVSTPRNAKTARVNRQSRSPRITQNEHQAVKPVHDQRLNFSTSIDMFLGRHLSSERCHSTSYVSARDDKEHLQHTPPGWNWL
jgi:hypothetical protein